MEYKKYKIKIGIVITSFSSFRTEDKSIIYNKEYKDIPIFDILDGETLNVVLDKSVRGLLGIKPKIDGIGWLELKNTKIIESDDHIKIIFAGVTPEEFKIRNEVYEWKKILEVIDRGLTKENQEILKQSIMNY